jgi:hypothetical protein
MTKIGFVSIPVLGVRAVTDCSTSGGMKWGIAKKKKLIRRKMQGRESPFDLHAFGEGPSPMDPGFLKLAKKKARKAGKKLVVSDSESPFARWGVSSWRTFTKGAC